VLGSGFDSVVELDDPGSLSSEADDVCGASVDARRLIGNMLCISFDRLNLRKNTSVIVYIQWFIGRAQNAVFVAMSMEHRLWIKGMQA